MLHVYRQITGLRQWHAVVFCQKREEATRFPFAEANIVRIPKPLTHPLRRIWVKQILHRPVMIYRSEARRIAREIYRVNGQVMHVYFGHIAVHLLPLLRQTPVPIIVSFHGADAMVDMDKAAYHLATIEVFQRARLILVRSQSLAEQLLRVGCPPEKIRLHRTGIPLDRFEFVPRAFPSSGAWRFFQACRLIPKKGLHTTLRAFALFAECYPKAELVIAGEGPMLEELKTFAAELGVRDRVTFPGFLSQEALRREYYAAHAFVHPSELGMDGNQEGVPNSMLEAMSTGLPVLATHHGGIPEAVDTGVSGFLVSERDHEALGRAMLDLAADPVRYATMGQAASEAVAERFEQKRQIAVLEDCYREALSTPSSASSKS